MKQLSINLVLLFVLTLFSLNGLSQIDETDVTNEGAIDNASKNKTTDPNEPLFSVKNELGQTVFAVYPNGVKIFIDDQLKAAGSGFSVGRLGTGKTTSSDYFSVVPGSVRVNIPDDGLKAAGSGFSVGRLGTGKTTSSDYFSVDPGNVRVNIPDDGLKAAGSGFSVGRLGTGKSTNVVDFFSVTPVLTQIGVTNSGATSNNGGFSVQKIGTAGSLSEELFRLNNDNTFLGNKSGNSITEGKYNAFLGFESGISNTVGMLNTFVGFNSGYKNIGGNNNVFIGEKSGFSNLTGNLNTFIGSESGFSNVESSFSTYVGHLAGKNSLTSYNTYVGYASGELGATGTNRAFFGYGAGNNSTGDDNTYIGVRAGANSQAGSRNVFLGTGAGENAQGSNNIIIGNNAGTNFIGDNFLVIDNASTDQPLIFGDFENHKLRFSGKVGVGRFPAENDFEVEGQVSKTSAGNWHANSDKRIKTEITDISNAIDIIMKLRPVKFKYTEEWKKMHPSIENKFYYNYIAQEYQNVFPESIYESGEFLPNDKKEILQIDTYNSQIVSIKAIQDLVNQNLKQQEEIDNLKAMVDKLSNEKQALNEKQQTIDARFEAMNNELVQLKSMIIQSGK